MYNIFLIIFGCVKIELSGSQIERLLTMAAKKKIPITDLKYANRTVTGNIAPKYFLRLKEARKGLDVRIRILKKSGVAFGVRPHRGRTGFLAGFIIFLLILKFLSLFVWDVKVSGNKTVESAKILEVCESFGIKNGCLQKSLDPKLLADKILLSIPKLTWVSVNIENCLVTVNVSEAERTEEYREKPPSNLIADRSGTITGINTVSGDTLVSIGDAVAKGDILVSGVMEAKGSRTFINSGGKIFAEVTKTFSEKGAFKAEEYVVSGKKERRVITLLWFDIPLYLGKIKGPYKIKTKTEKLSFLGADMPISVKKANFTLYKKRKVNYSEKRLEKKLSEKIDKRIGSEITGEYQIISVKKDIKDNKMTVTKTVKTVENIAKEVEIRIE